MTSVSVPLVCVKAGCEESVRPTVKLKLPLAVGVPMIVQSLASVVPAGNAPETSVVAQLYGASPPAPAIATPPSATPRVPLPLKVALSAGLDTGTVTTAGADVPPALLAV